MLRQDLRYAFRTLAANKGFAAVAVLCLALGIGTNATMFSIVDGVLIQPLPYQNPHELVTLNGSNPRAGIEEGLFSYPDLVDWRQQSTAFTTIAGMQGRSLTLSDREEPERLLGLAVSWDLFAMLGVQPVVGRPFRPDDDRPGAAPVVMLSHGVWQRRYAADPAIVGATVLVNGRPHTVIGVMPPRFEFTFRHRAWVPLAPLVHETPRDERGLLGIARLKPGATLAQAREEMDAVTGRLAARYPENEGWAALVRPIREEFVPDDTQLVLVAMMGAAMLVLVVACANVANLLLARASARHREIAVRSALGAGRGRIVRQLLTESVVLAALSAPLGVGLAFLGTDLIWKAMPSDDVPYYIHWAVDLRSLAYTAAIALGTGVVFGLAPALQASRGNLHENLKEGGRSGGAGAARNRLRNALVIAEVAVSLVLLVGGSLFVRSFLNLQGASGGFDPAPLMSMRFFMPGDQYESREAKVRRVEDVLRRVESLPGVEAAFASNLIPLSGGGEGAQVLVDGRVFPSGEEPRVRFVGVTPHFRRTLDLPLRAGRDFTQTEGLTRSGVALVNQMMAERLWPDRDPVGRRFRLKRDTESGDWLTVIGVVADFRHEEILDDAELGAYVPFPYSAWPNTGLTIRVQGSPALITDAVRRELRASDPGLPLFQIAAMEEVRQRGFWQYRIFGWMFSIFGLVALLLAAIGVYGVLAYSVSQRTQEIGVRVALGADRSAVLRLVVGQGIRLAGAGIAVGLLGAFGATRIVGSLLYNVTPTDPLSFAGIAAFLVGVAFVASYFPARRATAVDPIVALRAE